MNLSFRRCKRFLLLFLIFFSPLFSHGITIYGFHTGSCERDLGVILDVRGLDVIYLSLQGQIKSIRKFEIIFLSSYSVNELPYNGPINIKQIPPLRISTTSTSHDIIPMVEGWPIDFTQDKVSFLKFDGSEYMLDRSSIWGLEEIEDLDTIKMKFYKGPPISFLMPHLFRNCQVKDFYPATTLPPPTAKNQLRTLGLYPQQTLSEPLSIKREFDRLQESFKEIQRYNQEQRFYGRPQLYTNKATLGLWMSSGSRYGASESRTNMFLPVLVSDVSTGPFSYQHEFVTGVAPNFKSSHEEPHSQIFYTFKGSYFHLSAYFDPNLMLVGKKFDWKPNDFKKSDAKFHDKSFLEMGFDYGPFALQIYFNNTLESGFFVEEGFQRENLQIPRLGFLYFGPKYYLEFFSGSTDLSELKKKYEFSIKRFNIKSLSDKNFSWWASYITRQISFEGPFSIDDKSDSIILGHSQNFRKSLKWAIELGLESQKLNYTTLKQINLTENHLYPKLNTMVSIEF